ncbi:MAG: hypothetical protein H6677_27820 [Candidatus Obscuribacterales bacterium]|nr:hypothetical protein [Candidatus Obscuribacterales bacterium]
MADQIKKLISCFKGKKVSGASRSDVEGLSKQVYKILEPMRHQDRTKHLILIARLARPDLKQAKLLEPYYVDSTDQITRDAITAFFKGLFEGDFQDRYFALLSCFGNLDGKRVLSALKDKSRTLRILALSMAAIVMQDDELKQGFPGLELDSKKKLLLSLLKRKRFALVDELLDEQIEGGTAEVEVVELLPFGGVDLVKAYFSRYEDLFGQREWIRLARVHPELALDLLGRKVRDLQFPDRYLLDVANSVLAVAARSATDDGIKLIKNLLEHYSLGQIGYEHYMRYRPREIADLLLASDLAVPHKVTAVLHRLSDKQVMGMVARLNSSGASHYGGGAQAWMEKLSPSLRAELFEQYRELWRDANGAIASALIKYLPSKRRQEEARAHLAMEELKNNLAARLPYFQFLPFEESSEELQSFLGDPDPDVRAQAISALVGCVRFDRGAVSGLLEFLSLRKNEPDPVRALSLSSMAALPPSVWRSEELDRLSQIFRDGLNAKDLSHASTYYMQDLCIAILPFHQEWAADWLASILKERNVAQFGDLTRRLNESQARALSARLNPVIDSLGKLEKENIILNVAQCFGKRLEVFDELVRRLEDLVDTGSSTYISQRALAIIFSYRTDRLQELVPRILKKDPTWFQNYQVAEYISRQRQDLLTPYLGQKAYRGKFGTGKICVVPRFQGGYYRWTREQRRIYEKALESLTTGKVERGAGDIFFALKGLSSLPDSAIDVIVQHARLKEADKQAVRDYAIHCLADMDDGSGVKELIECLSDDRARVAIYVLREALLDMDREEALEILTLAPRRQITVAKEIVRLIGELKTDSAFVTLVEINQSELHRDVKIALLRALWNFLEREQTWKILQAVVRDSDRSIARHMVRIPTERISRRTEENLVKLLAELLNNDDSIVRSDVLHRLTYMPIADRSLLLKDGLVRSLKADSTSENRSACSAFVNTYAAQDTALVAEAFTNILSRRRTLSCLIDSIASYFEVQGERALPVVRATLETLKKDRLTLCQRLRLACKTLPSSELVEYIRHASENNDLHPEALMQAVRSIESASRRADIDQLILVETAFSEDSSELLRRVALAALSAQASSGGWTEERLERLARFREDKSALVAEAAQFTLPSAEIALAGVSG